MVTIKAVQEGLSDYLDDQLIPKLPNNSMYKILVGTVSAIGVKRFGKIVSELSSNPIVSALEIVKGDCIDIDTLFEELKNQMPEEGVRLQADVLGKMNMSFTKSDIDELRHYIMRRC